MTVAPQLAIATLTIGLQQVGRQGHRFVPILGTLEHQSKKVDQDDTVALRRTVGEHRLVADRDAVLVDADLTAIEPEGLVENDLVGLPGLRYHAMGDAKLRPVRPAPRRNRPRRTMSSK